MKNYPKKSFFKEPRKDQIIKLKQYYTDSDLINRIEFLEEDEALVIDTKLVPGGFRTSRKFLKHGPDVKLKRIHSLDDVVNINLTPVFLREEAFNAIQNKAYSAYSFKPFIGADKRTRRVSLVECLEAARLFAYAHQVPRTGIEVKEYDLAQKVKKEGADIVVRVPSRRQKQRKYQFRLFSVPIIDNPDKFAIVQGIGSYGYESKRALYEFGYKYESDKEDSKKVNLFAHEIVAYLKIADIYWNEHKNMIPLMMNPFAIPTQKTVDFYKNLCDRVLIRDENLESKDKLRKLNKAEKEILLWGFVYKHKHDDTFFAKEKLQDYKWK